MAGEEERCVEENENKCLQYIEHSMRLLQQAREGVLNSASTATSSTITTTPLSSTAITQQPSSSSAGSVADDVIPSSFSQRASEDFRTSFPGLSVSTTGRHLQSHLPNIRGGGRHNHYRSQRAKNSSSVPYSRPATSSPTSSWQTAHTWTHEFICLSKVNTQHTPSISQLAVLRGAGLGKKKVVFKNKIGNHQHVRETLESYFPRLKSQEGAFHLAKASSGGCGIRSLSVLNCLNSGYEVQFLKEEARASTIFIAPLNADIDTSPVTINDLSTLVEVPECECSSCHCKIPLMEFKNHKSNCSCENDSEEQTLHAPGMSTEEEALIQLKRIFPDHDSEQLKSILRTALSLNDAIDIVLDDKVDLPKSINISPSQDQASSLQKFFSTNALITHFQKDIEEVMKLNIDRVELWRMALSFYKKSMKNPHELKKALEVQFSSTTGENESTDAGAIKIEFFELLLDEFRKRSFEGDYPNLVPRRGDSINFLIFGIVLGHSILHGGPGFYALQPWVFEVIAGFDKPEHLMTLVTKDDIPLHAGSSNLLEFIKQLDYVKTKEELDIVVDKYMQIINCSRWDQTATITLGNKSLLLWELVYEELVLKRRSQIKSIQEGLEISGLLRYIKDYPDLCRPIFVSSCMQIKPEELLNVIKNDEHEDYEKQQAFKYLEIMIKGSSSSVLSRLLKFATGYSNIPPWGLGRQIVIKYHADDEDKIYPEAMVCFSILYLPTVHSNEASFICHFEKALDVEGVGFSASS